MITTKKDSIKALGDVVAGIGGVEADARETEINLARQEFFEYCHLVAPSFYKRDRAYLVELCETLQNFWESDASVLVINMPPRHGKSRTAQLFAQWLLGRDHSVKIMTGSYNETLASTFSKGVRNAIQEEKADIGRIVYRDVFPGTKIRHGDASMKLWSLTDGYNNYLATSPGGTATGFGATLEIIDDLIKSDYEAHNDAALDAQWSWFTDTMLSRLEEGGKIIIIMTRWSTRDLAGRALEHYAEQGTPAKHICMKALQDDGSMLCPEVLSHRSYMAKMAATGQDIALANYQQEPMDLQGTLYTSFKTYDSEPVNSFGKSLFTGIKAYCDTADTGGDYLCCIVYGVYEKEAYVLDVLYTQAPMEITEGKVAKMMSDNRVNKAMIESNNGGRGFARAVERILKERYHTNRTKIKWFHQSKNKQARILTNSTWVMDHIYYPKNWRDRWPEYHKAMTTYQRDAKNAHDDAPDATTGVAENMEKGGLRTFNRRS